MCTKCCSVTGQTVKQVNKEKGANPCCSQQDGASANHFHAGLQLGSLLACTCDHIFKQRTVHNFINPSISQWDLCSEAGDNCTLVAQTRLVLALQGGFHKKKKKKCTAHGCFGRTVKKPCVLLQNWN